MEEGGNSTAAGNKLQRTLSSTPNDSSGRPEEAILDLIVSIFDQCGLFPNHGNDPSELLQSLLVLLSKIQLLDQSNDDLWMKDQSREDISTALLSYGRGTDNQDADTLLLELEQCFHQVRATAAVFVQTTLPQERCEIAALRDAFVDQYDSQYGADRSCTGQWWILVQTIVAHFIHQLQMEESLIHQKLYPLLNSIYNTKIDAVKASLQQLIHCLSRNTFLECIPYRLAVEQLEKMTNGNLDHMSYARQLPRMKPSSLRFSSSTVAAVDPAKACFPTEALDRIKTCTSIPSAVFDEFISFVNSLDVGKIRALILMGSVGSGKSFVCDEIEQLALSLQEPSLFVIRPRLPMDVLQSRVGETEDVLVSLFEAIQHHEARNVLVMLDDLEYMVGESSSDLERHFIRRCRSTFFTLFDSLHRMLPHYGKNVLFICTTSIPEVVHVTAVRFDRVVQLEPPNATERERLIRFYFPMTDSKNNDSPSIVSDKEDNLVDNVVEATVGKSYAELMQLCRQSMEMVVPEDPHQTVDAISFNRQVLLAMKEWLQTIIPESLRSEYVDGYVDMRVWSARDLLQQLSIANPFNISHDYERQMHGSPSASLAWKVLQSSIIIPLCKSKELRQLLDRSADAPKSLMGAVLLTGDSGSGKSALALHCARRAATLLPAMKLMEVTCTSLVHKEVGASEQAIQHLFAAARRAAPAIVLMDGIETIAATRGNDATTEGTMDRILSTLLVELDGIDGGGGTSPVSGIAVIGITRVASWIDPALKRPGRFDRVLHLSRDWEEL